VSPAYSAWTKTADASRIRMVIAKSNTVITFYTFYASVGASPEYSLGMQYVSDPIDGQTISGTVKAQIICRESNAATDATMAITIKVVSNDGGTLRGTLLAIAASDLINTSPPEWTTTATNRRFLDASEVTPVTLTPVVAQDGDRIVVEIGMREVTTTSSRYGRFWLGDDGASDLPEDDTTTDTTMNPWIEFSQTIDWPTAPVSMPYSTSFDGVGVLMFKTGAKTFDIFWAENLTNGITPFICRKIKKRSIDFSTTPATLGSITEKDIGTPSGLEVPVSGARFNIGYDFDSDELLIVLGEWNGLSCYMDSTIVKLLAVKRDFSTVTVKHSDLLTLVQTVHPTVIAIRDYGHAYGYGGKIVCVVAAMTIGSSPTNERDVYIKYDGTWAAVNPTLQNNTCFEGLEPLWGTDDTFYGWLVEGHGCSSIFIKYSDLSYRDLYGELGGMTHTTEPVWDMLNHKVIFTEWGSSQGDEAGIWRFDPDPTLGIKNGEDLTPQVGSMLDLENNYHSINKANKANGCIYLTGTGHWLIQYSQRTNGGAPVRISKTDLESLSDDDKWNIMRVTGGSDLYYPDGICRTIDPSTKLFLPTRVISASPALT